MRVLLMGGTDLTLSIANAMRSAKIGPAACVGIGESFEISYSKDKIVNSRIGKMREWSQDHCVPYLESTNTDKIIEFADSYGFDMCLAAGWYHFVPHRLRSKFQHGTLGLHASLLPELRGGAPLNWAIITGLRRTGISLFVLGDGVDDGPIVGQRIIQLDNKITIKYLVEKSLIEACDLACDCLPKLFSGEIRAHAQVGVPTYGLQRTPEDGMIDWHAPSEQIHRLVRAVSEPYTGAFSTLNGRQVRIWEAEIGELPKIYGCPGQIARVPECPDPVVITGSTPLIVCRASFNDGTDAIETLRSSNNQRFH